MFLLLPQPLKLKLALSVPLLIPSARWLQAEVFSFSLPFVFLDAHYTLLYPTPLSLVYPITSCKMELSVVGYSANRAFGSLNLMH